MYELPTKMSATKVLKKVKELQKQYPNAQYFNFNCKYFSGPVCNGPKTHGRIIGQAIRELYPENVAAIKKIERKININSLQKSNINVSVEEFFNKSKTVEKLADIQSDQDSGIPWGKCQ